MAGENFSDSFLNVTCALRKPAARGIQLYNAKMQQDAENQVGIWYFLSEVRHWKKEDEKKKRGKQRPSTKTFSFSLFINDNHK